jgi:pantoate--beta-alanine ligase
MADAIRVHDTIDGFRRALDALRATGATVGFVPTMGYLHDGHASLMREAARRDDVAVASIFVNPLQFAATEDLSTYPRDLARDLALAEAAGVTEVFHPGVEEMYPRPVLTTVTVADITRHFEGAARPEHFAGVATVVTKLFSIVGPCRSYFGEKDYQQLAVVRRLAADLSLPVEVVGCPTVREADGLAMSSRNVYLTPEQRAAAPVLHRAMGETADAVAAGARDVAVLTAALAERIAATAGVDGVDYAEIVDADTLQPASVVAGVQRILVAARFGRTRLLDNLALEVSAGN